jgi:hypothetical protein
MRRRAVRVAHVVKTVEEGDQIEARLQIIGWMTEMAWNLVTP